MAQAASNISAKLSEANLKLSPKIGRNSRIGSPGPLGFTKPRDKFRQELDETFDVAPREGDPGYVPPPGPPVVPAPIPMPDPDSSSQASIAARRRSVQAQALRRGRMSTILSQSQSEPLGA